ncbi:hypothetical protein [Fulvivirga sedimenti]|uniref:DUF2306 domain-containing protein n=1 Tax=Fulvivirga sedimenti TaxID=2879465 RepID=A0A9X1L164_9BACT|nr:hypothetical protein [Fulvivirga sedimenti]MCA6075592.1 hypothetical protein [Fulvivirga sedimenti]MCA6076769.1 hypothetical protein [Fulvivirga sedimenti]MCA6077897.1 hypothetical protein [Fulvivirga sedimenti]
MKLKSIPTKKSDHYFFLFYAFYFLITQFIGFSYTASVRIENEGGLPLIAVIHGVFGGLWYALFGVQCLLITGKKVKWHMILGPSGIPIVIGVFLTGIYAVFRVNTPEEEIPFEIMSSEIVLFIMGLIYATLGFVNRKKAHAHKRYFLMSMIMLSPAGIARFWELTGIAPSEVIYFVLFLFIIPILSILAYDLLAYRRVFKATVVSLIAYALSLYPGSLLGQWVVDYIRPLFL